MEYEESHQTDAKMVRVTITLNELTYDRIKGISKDLGLRPSTWMTMVCTSKANGISVDIENGQ